MSLIFAKKFIRLAVEYKHITETQADELYGWYKSDTRGDRIDKMALAYGYLSEAQTAEILSNMGVSLANGFSETMKPSSKSMALKEKSILSFFQPKSAKIKIDIWEEIARYPYYQNSPDSGFQHVFSALKKLFYTPCFYLYLLNETADKLILESSDFAGLNEYQGITSLDADIIDHLRAPDLSIKMQPEHENFKILQNWGIELINIPLFVEGRTFIGNILTGPQADKKIDQKTLDLIDPCSEAASIAIETIKEFQRLREEIQALNSRSQVSKRMLGSALEVNRFVDLLLDLALTATKAESGFVAITDIKKSTMTVRAHKNLPDGFFEKLDLSAREGLFEWPSDLGEVLILRDYNFIDFFKVKSILAVPLIENKELIGVFALLSFKNKNYFTEFSLSILTNFVEQIKLVLNNSKLFDEFTKQYFATLVAMSNAYDFRSPYTAGHSRRVANVSAEIAWIMKLPPRQIEIIKDAGLIHDVGMCGVVEIGGGFQADYNHPEIGASMIELLPISEDLIDCVKTHHEWYDGWGFPKGLKGNQILISGKILAIAEFFVETTANNKMKKSLDWERLIEELSLRSGSQFDPQVVKALQILLTKKRETAKTRQIEECWKFKGEPDDVCSNCPAYKRENRFCWIYFDVNCEKHGDITCDDCFIYTEWLQRMQTIINNKQIEVKKMEHNISEKNALTVLSLKGEVDVSVAPQLRTIFKTLIERGKINIIVDLQGVEFIDSSGLGIFVVAFKSAKAKGGNIKFSGATTEVLNVIKLTRLDKHFELFKTVELAEMSF